MIQQLLYQVDLAIFRAKKEPLMCSVLEAIALGLSVIVSRDGEEVGPVQNKINSFSVKPNSLEALRSALEYFFSPQLETVDANKLARFGSQARQAIYNKQQGHSYLPVN